MYPMNYYKSRGPVTTLNKFNPIWWMGNKDDPITQEKYDHLWPDDALWIRKLKWFRRNPLANFRRYVIGFWDKQHIWTRQRWRRTDSGLPINKYEDMWPLPGEKFGICMTFISFYLWGFEGYVGHKPSGEWGGPCVRKRK